MPSPHRHDSRPKEPSLGFVTVLANPFLTSDFPRRSRLQKAALGLGPRELGTVPTSRSNGKNKGNAMSERTSKLIEKGKAIIEKVELMERRRMEKLLKSHIAAKDHVRDLQDRLREKFDAKSKLLADMREELRERNLQKMMQNTEMRRELMLKLEEKHAESMKAKQLRQQQAEQVNIL